MLPGYPSNLSCDTHPCLTVPKCSMRNVNHKQNFKHHKGYTSKDHFRQEIRYNMVPWCIFGLLSRPGFLVAFCIDRSFEKG